MSRRKSSAIPGAMLAALLAMLALGTAVSAQAPDAIADPYAAAASHAGVALELVVAIAGAESGYHPWALDVDGHQVYCRSREEAEQMLATLSDDANVDIGLMQINLRFWGHRLGVTKFDLLEPRTNLAFGAQILRQGLVRHGTIWRRISNYHSGSKAERERYNQQVYSIYQQYLRGEIR
ncbi:MAG TPA: lytic transglycosylase domain-containing protein [Candidatus Binataceae bacterium]|nr:lytic transglycosylase domain-containing protein [Candidatus Binataceae bacterium]